VRASRKRTETLELARSHDFIGDQHVADAAEDHRFGLAYFLAADADCAMRDLAQRYCRAFVRLGVRANAHVGAVQRLRQPGQVVLECIEVEKQGRRIHLVHGHAGSGRRRQRVGRGEARDRLVHGILRRRAPGSRRHV
jgi:hypothetical protein